MWFSRETLPPDREIALASLVWNAPFRGVMRCDGYADLFVPLAMWLSFGPRLPVGAPATGYWQLFYAPAERR